VVAILTQAVIPTKVTPVCVIPAKVAPKGVIPAKVAPKGVIPAKAGTQSKKLARSARHRFHVQLGPAVKPRDDRLGDRLRLPRPQEWRSLFSYIDCR